jgi:phosphoserine phosphatase RsbU/P
MYSVMPRLRSVRATSGDYALPSKRRGSVSYHDAKTLQTQQVAQAAWARELQLAHTVQQSMAPRSMPCLTGFDFGARLEPAGAVGGDFFDFLPLDADHLGIVVGDVAGKGMPAALFMAMATSLFRVEARRHAAPRQTLECLNQYLLEYNDAALFVTMLYGVLDRRTRMFTYARAGHEQPLLVAADGAVRLPAMESGQPLGVFATPALDEQCVAVPAGGALLLYTDGVTEMMDRGHHLFGLERLEALLCAYRNMAPQTLCNRLWQDLTAYCDDAPPSDDVTLIAVRALADQPRLAG